MINYRQNDIDGLGVMTDEKNFISLAEVAPELPVTMMGLLNINGWQAEVALLFKEKVVTYRLGMFIYSP